MQYRIPKNDKNEFIITARNFAKHYGNGELNQVTTIDGDNNKIIVILQDDFVNQLTDQQRNELLIFTQ